MIILSLDIFFCQAIEGVKLVNPKLENIFLTKKRELVILEKQLNLWRFKANCSTLKTAK